MAIIGSTLHSRNRNISEVLKPVKTQGSIKTYNIINIQKIHGEPRPWGNEATVSYVLRILQWRARYESSKASEIESKETFRTSLSQRGAKVSLDLLRGHS